MSLEFLGTDYGGWLLDLDLIPENSIVISAGVGEDISFDLELIKRKACHIIGIDPTPKSHRFIENQPQLGNFELIKKALDDSNNNIIEIYKNKNLDHVSESILPHHASVKNFDYYLTETVSLPILFEKYDNVSLVKMDIEGSEYKVLNSLKVVPPSVRQICVEFHHFCSNYSLDDTKRLIEHLKKLGFSKCVQNKKDSWAELTFIRKGQGG